MKSENVGGILVEPYFERKTPDAIARITGAKVVIMPSSVGGDMRARDYLQLFDYDLAFADNGIQGQPVKSLGERLRSSLYCETALLLACTRACADMVGSGH